MNDRLFRAFQDNAARAEGCASPEEIWRAVAGRAGQAQTAALVDHTIRCGDCARLWRMAREAQTATAEPAATLIRVRPPRWVRRAALAGAGLAAAASVLLLVRRPVEVDSERGAPSATIASATSPALPREAFLLRWASQGAGARYRVEVMLLDLTEIDSAAELTVPEHLVPEAALARVRPGTDVVWRVEARLPDGRSVTSGPFRTPVR